MYWLKSCPRCQGDLHDSTDSYGNYVDCLQCGHYLTVVEEADLNSQKPKSGIGFIAQGVHVKVSAA